MFRIIFVLAALAAVFTVTPQANASVLAKIDLSEQRMHVYVNGAMQGSWPVSTARRGYRTPTGSFRPQRLHRRYYSRRYHGSPMPHSVFFYKGYAIHGTEHVDRERVVRLGSIDGHDCDSATLLVAERRGQLQLAHSSILYARLNLGSVTSGVTES